MAYLRFYLCGAFRNGPRDFRHFKLKLTMQMSEKVWKQDRGLKRLDLTSHVNKNLHGNKSPLDDLVHDRK